MASSNVATCRQGGAAQGKARGVGDLWGKHCGASSEAGHYGMSFGLGGRCEWAAQGRLPSRVGKLKDRPPARRGGTSLGGKLEARGIVGLGEDKSMMAVLTVVKP